MVRQHYLDALLKPVHSCGSLSLLLSVSLKEEFKGNDRITKAFKESLKDAYSAENFINIHLFKQYI